MVRDGELRLLCTDPAGSAGRSMVLETQLPPSCSSMPDPPPPPRILLRGESSRQPAALDTSVTPVAPRMGQQRLKYIDGGWTEVKSRKNRRFSSGTPGNSSPPRRQGPDRRRAFNFKSSPSRDAFLSRFKGLCLRCLSLLHQRKDCRDPLCCIICKLPGHFGTEWPENPKNKDRRGSAGDRLGPLQPVTSVEDRHCFHTPPPPTPPPPPATTMVGQSSFSRVDPSCRPCTSNTMVVSPRPWTTSCSSYVTT